jgi:CBS-domain-containing membrane protein
MADRHMRLRSLKEALEEITAAGEEARLQLALLAAEARDKKEGLEASIGNLELKLDRSIDQAVQTATSKTKQLTRTLQEFLSRHSLPNGKTGASVRSIMQDRVVTCTDQDCLQRPAQIMWDVNCGSVPVTGFEGKLCGVITDRDICMAAYTQGLPLWKIRVGDVMTKAVHTCRGEQSVAEAVELMGVHKVRRLPVIDEQGRPIGIISIADIVRHSPALGLRVAQNLIFELIRSVSEPHAAGPGGSRQAGEQAAAE